jgi:hypothetical protein
LFDVRRSIRYHDRRRAFFERLHQVTGGLTVLLAGSVLFDLARPGETAAWLLMLAALAAALSAWDIVVGYARRAAAHGDLRRRFIALEMAMLAGDVSPATWAAHRHERLVIERDEPPIYRALDLLCHNELLRAEGVHAGEHRAPVGFLPRLTRHFFHWADLAAS